MSAEQPPRGNYYDSQFAYRIQHISKGGGSPPPAPKKTGNGGRGFGILAAVVIMAVVRTIGSFSSPSPRHTPPDIPRFQPNGLGQQLPDWNKLDKQFDELRRAQDALHDLGVQQAFLDEGALKETDFAHLPAFCGVIRLQTQNAALTPGKRIVLSLDPVIRRLVDEIADCLGDPKPESVARLLAALNRDVLGNEDFYDRRYFDGVKLPLEALGMAHTRAFNRTVIECAFPTQVFRRDQQDLDLESRINARLAALEDFERMRKRAEQKP